jgi:hypothetical protein
MCGGETLLIAGWSIFAGVEARRVDRRVVAASNEFART